jgi:hypothetical protein
MADSPCTRCGERCNGKLFFAYVNYYDDEQLIKRRLRMCQECVFQHFGPLIEFADRQTTRGNWVPEEGNRQWQTAVDSAITEIVQLVKPSSPPINETTPMSGEGAGTASTPSAATATPAQSRQLSASSRRSTTQALNGRHGKS